MIDRSKLPRIMYDQTQFMCVYWIDQNGCYINDEFYKRTEEISGYAPDTWITYTQNLPESFWFGAYDEDALSKEAEMGLKNFSDPDFLKLFDSAMGESYQKTLSLKEGYFQNFYNREKEVVHTRPDLVEGFLKGVRDADTYILSYYFLTQPQRFYRLEEELQKLGLTKETELLSTNGRALTYVSELRKAIVDYADHVLRAGVSPEEYKSNHSDDYNTLKEVVKRLGFLNCGLFGGDLIAENNLDEEINMTFADEKSLVVEKGKLDELGENIEKRNILLKNNSSPAYLLADIMGHASVARFDLQTCILCVLKYVDNLLKEVAAQNGLTEDELKSYEFEEVLELIRSGKKIASDLVMKRQEGFLRVYRHDGIQTFIGAEARKEIASLLEYRKNEIKNTKTLKGTVASWPDKNVETVTGSALVVTTAFGADDKVKAMKPGEILVATQTHPNLVPKMKEAAAIVTDEGGITCHAAIVSRELGKPCIIGTRLASKVIKAGDVITLDLRTGEVILN